PRVTGTFSDFNMSGEGIVPSQEHERYSLDFGAQASWQPNDWLKLTAGADWTWRETQVNERSNTEHIDANSTVEAEAGLEVKF
ncbi:MAG: hypothetical protein QF535_09045, partial [Anaerolineales bacterium]|nr:hypothetical protein [Anaerolineales bacterium]